MGLKICYGVDCSCDTHKQDTNQYDTRYSNHVPRLVFGCGDQLQRIGRSPHYQAFSASRQLINFVSANFGSEVGILLI